MHPYIHSSATDKGQGVEATQMPIDRWTAKEGVARTDDGILLGHEKEWNNAICSHVDGPGEQHTE